MEKRVAALTAPAAAPAFADLPEEVRLQARRLVARGTLCQRHLPPAAAAAAAAAAHANASSSSSLAPYLQVLALTASLGLTEARDVACLAATNKRLAAVCKAAPLRLGGPCVLPSAPAPPQSGSGSVYRYIGPGVQ